MIQFDPNKNQAGKGSGFGLLICKGIVDLHGGKIWVESEGLGDNMLFIIYG